LGRYGRREALRLPSDGLSPIPRHPPRDLTRCPAAAEAGARRTAAADRSRRLSATRLASRW